ncbi:MAG: DNA repair protein RecN [Gammaproteobacteria bacterium]
MLLDLKISQLALVTHLELSFRHGMTVITGETGAGKSILLTALNLLVGAKTDPVLIRSGADSAEVSATFDISGLSGAVLWLADVDLTNEEATQDCVIRRLIYTNGRSKAYINGKPVTQAQLKALGEYLVQMHGQHKHQMLLKPYEQLRLLDAYGHHSELLAQCQNIAGLNDKLMKQKRLLLNEQNGLSDQLSLLRYQFDELEQLELKPQEFSSLSEQHTVLAHSEENSVQIEATLIQLESGTDNVHHVIKQLEGLAGMHVTLKNVIELLEPAAIHLQEAQQELSDIKDNLELNPEGLHQIEQRLDQLHQMARKHRVEPDALYNHAHQLSEKIESLSHSQEKLLEIDRDLETLSGQYQRIADALSKARKETALILAHDISKTISELGMQGASFSVLFETINTPTIPQSHGYDEVTFCMSANPGHPPQPLHKVASGGELSRMSLAIQLMTAEAEHTPTLIFDEADVGVGGQTAIQIGQALKRLAEKAQVFCVTHLPQVAAFGDQHLLVQKDKGKEQTESSITELKGDTRLAELARMLSGDSRSKQALANAKAMLAEVV